MEITKEFKFSAAHILPNHDGKCRRLHGHNYRVLVTVQGDVRHDDYESPEQGMVVDFAVLKEIWNNLFGQWDHTFIARGDEWPYFAREDSIRGMDLDEDITYLGVRTTAENLAMLIFNGFSYVEGVNVSAVKVYETDSSYAEYKGTVA